MTRTNRLGAAIAVAAAIACASSGCAVIPVSGPFTIDEGDGGGSMSKPFQRMIAIPPRPRWSPQQVVDGLRAAMAAYDGDTRVLMQYLTPEAQHAWSPDGPVTVIDNGYKLAFDPKNTAEQSAFTLTGTQVARIEDDDRYVPANADLSWKFTVVKTPQGGYRIASITDPDTGRPVRGLLLTRADVDRAYRATNLYYLNSPPGSEGTDTNRLVVDRVRLRVRPTESFAETIVERLLKGPSQALQGAVYSVFPPEMRVVSVRQADERVVITLSGPLAAYEEIERPLKLQLRWSLSDNNVVNGREIEVHLDGDTAEPMTVEANLKDTGQDPAVSQAYYTSRGAVRSIDQEGPGLPVQGPAGQPNTANTDLTVSAQGDLVAARSKAGGIWVSRVAADGKWERWIQGDYQDLTPPSWHRDGTLWTYDRRSGAVLRCYPSGGRGAERIAAPALDGLDVTSLRIARDGVRVAVTIGKNEVRVGALARSAGSPMLANFQPLVLPDSQGKDEITDIAWHDGEHLLVLSNNKASQTVKEVNVGDGTTETLPGYKDRFESLAALGDRILGNTADEILEFNLDKQGWSPKINADVGPPIFPLG
ncbi:LpqB family beta-propeller domain-containing protein [Nonomuraea sp. NPDC000554]|uniref:LpqB family beta-propeller domain-containing protein n=1 Tax=Nonomuraea sp. NPDC000554 TaxID=3154259 RepID=UPI0033276CC1